MLCSFRPTGSQFFSRGSAAGVDSEEPCPLGISQRTLAETSHIHTMFKTPWVSCVVEWGPF